MTILERLPGWGAAMDNLSAWAYGLGPNGRTRLDDAVTSAQGYADVYQGRRASSIVDAVASSQHRYQAAINSVAQFETNWPGTAMAQLAAGTFTGCGLSTARWTTITGIAEALRAYQAAHPLLPGANDDSVLLSWALETEPLRLAVNADPVGQVKGFSTALFAYLRMRSGADAIKPDVRLRKKLAALGFPIPEWDNALIVYAESAASALGVPRLALDQLLW